MKEIKIGNKTIGPNSPCLIVAEAGGNANSDINIAKKLIEEAAKAGADAIKFQNYRARKLVTKTAPKYWVDTMKEWKEGVRPYGVQMDEFKLLDRLPKEAYPELVEMCKKLGIIFFSTPFDKESVDFLDEIGVPMFKIASADITYHSFLEYIAKKGKPIILSTGASTIKEIQEAVDVITAAGNDQIVLLHCILHYPTAAENANIRMMQTIQKDFPEYPVGLSDHTIGTLIPTIAAALGARMIEKHYTIDKSLPDSSDHFMSVDPPEMKKMMSDIRTAEKALGSAEKKPIQVEMDALKYARRSIVAVQNIPAGTVITEDMVTCKRPGTGLQPKFLKDVIGKKTKAEMKEDHLIKLEELE